MDLESSHAVSSRVDIEAIVFIGAGVVMTRDLKTYALMIGFSAKQVGWMSEFGELIESPLQGGPSYFSSTLEISVDQIDGCVTMDVKRR